MSHNLVRIAVVLASICQITQADEDPIEQPLWPADAVNPISYADGEQSRSNAPAPGSLSKKNRVFSQVATASFTIHRPKAGTANGANGANGVGLVICPGGGYTDVWLDREGHDLALRLAEHGVTSLVLKYRTNSGGLNDKRVYPWEVFMPAVISDAHQALRTLRAQATELKLQKDRIGICGFSAGGHLALSAVLEAKADDPSARVDFAGLFYPWLNGPPLKAMDGVKFPPMFVMNAADDTLTRADRCIEFYLKLLKDTPKTELHIYNKGQHGFDLATDRAASAALWPASFMAWMKDIGF